MSVRERLRATYRRLPAGPRRRLGLLRQEAVQHRQQTRAQAEVDAIERDLSRALRSGSLGDAALLALERVRRTGTVADWVDARSLVGRLCATDDRWQPVVTGPGPGSVDGSRVVHVLAQSLPFADDGYCRRTHQSLTALVRDGWDIVPVTMPGFPGAIDGSAVADRSVVGDVTYRHLLPHAASALEALGMDEYLQLSAQMLAGVVAQEQAALLHIKAGERGFDTALAGNAVARWAGLPWVFEVRYSLDGTRRAAMSRPRQDDYDSRRFETQSRMLHAASLIVTSSDALCEEIVRQYDVSYDRVRVVPDSEDSWPGLAAAIGDVYDQLLTDAGFR